MSEGSLYSDIRYLTQLDEIGFQLISLCFASSSIIVDQSDMRKLLSYISHRYYIQYIGNLIIIRYTVNSPQKIEYSTFHNNSRTNLIFKFIEKVRIHLHLNLYWTDIFFISAFLFTTKFLYLIILFEWQHFVWRCHPRAPLSYYISTCPIYFSIFYEAIWLPDTMMFQILQWLYHPMMRIILFFSSLLQLMKMANKVLGDRLFTMLMKATFYGHFVAGEDEQKIRPVLDRLRQFGVKPILDYSVEEDLSQEEAERREVQWVYSAKNSQTWIKEFSQHVATHIQSSTLSVRASVSEAGDQTQEGTIKKYHVEKSFADRRYKVASARTYFYLNEASCERNMDVFIRCLEAVAGNDRKKRYTSSVLFSRPFRLELLES